MLDELNRGDGTVRRRWHSMVAALAPSRRRLEIAAIQRGLMLGLQAELSKGDAALSN